METIVGLNLYQFLIGFLGGIFLFGLIEAILWFVPGLRKNVWNNPKLIFGYHVHHSVYGLISILLGLCLFVAKSDKAIFWVGFGLGTILIHTITGGFVFIEKVSKPHS